MPPVWRKAPGRGRVVEEPRELRHEVQAGALNGLLRKNNQGNASEEFLLRGEKNSQAWCEL